MKIIYIIIFFLLSLQILKAQTIYGCIDTVYSFKPGTGQNLGQDAPYFPNNIFGVPYKNASYNVPASSPEDVCSLGLGGEIIVGFKNYVLRNGDGADFTIFENAFLNPATNKIFAEPAKIAVSQDGITFYEFPFDSLTLKGCAGKTPTNGDKDPFNPLISGGDSFDINDLDLDYISYIKITDISKMILDNPSHPYYDPIISGFDLDAVAGIYLSKRETLGIDDKTNEDKDFVINQTNNYLMINCTSETKCHSVVSIYDMTGRLMIESTFTNFLAMNTSTMTESCYILKIVSYDKYFTKLIYIYR